MTEKDAPNYRKLPRDLHNDLLRATLSIEQSLVSGGIDPSITNLEVRDDYHITTNHLGNQAQLSLIKHKIRNRGYHWNIVKENEVYLGELLLFMSQYGGVKGTYRHLVKSTTGYDMMDLMAKQVPDGYLELLDKAIRKENTSINLVANQTIEYLLAEIDRLSKKIEELELRAPETGGAAPLAAEQHWEEATSGVGT